MSNQYVCPDQLRGYTPYIDEHGTIEPFIENEISMAHFRNETGKIFSMKILPTECFAGDDDKHKHEKQGDARARWIFDYTNFCEATIRAEAEGFDLTITAFMIATSSEEVEFVLNWEYNETQNE